MKRTKLHIVYNLKDIPFQWELKLAADNGRAAVVLDTFVTKRKAVETGKWLAKSLNRPVQLMIHRKDGTFQTEHTYPRSSDPRRYKG